jgi:hypothetical protein
VVIEAPPFGVEGVAAPTTTILNPARITEVVTTLALVDDGERAQNKISPLL